MLNRLTRHGTFAVALFSLLSPSKSRAADAETEARERYERAVQLYEDGAYDAALVELRRAAELRPSYKLYYNIAQVELAMNDYAAALKAYRHYLLDGADHVQAARRDAVQKEIDKLLQRVATVTIKTDVDGADVYVDDSLVGTTPLAAPVLVNAGVRRIAVRHPDYLPQSRSLALTGASQEKVVFSLVASAPGAAPGTSTVPATREAPAPPKPAALPAGSAPAPAPAPAEAAPSGPSHAPVWIGWGITSALVVGASVTGGIALSKNSDLADARGQAGVSSSDLHSKADDVRTMAVVTDSLIAAAVIAGGVSLWLTLDSHSKSEQKAAHVAPPPGARVAVGVGLGSVRLRGSF